MFSGLFGIGQPVGAFLISSQQALITCSSLWRLFHIPITMSICGILIQLLLSVLSSQPGRHTTPSRIKQPSPGISLKHSLKASQLQRLSLSIGLVRMGIPGPFLNPVVLIPGFVYSRVILYPSGFWLSKTPGYFSCRKTDVLDFLIASSWSRFHVFFPLGISDVVTWIPKI